MVPMSILKEGKLMICRRIRARVSSCCLLTVTLVLPLFAAACGGDAAKYSGHWKRTLTGEGEVEMRLASNGNMELMLPSPRWPDAVDIKERAMFKGDTITFKADTARKACETADAHYVISRNGNELQIAGVGMDSCGSRRVGLVGRWVKA